MAKPLNAELKKRLSKVEREEDFALALAGIRRMISIVVPEEKEPICEWIQRAVDLSYDRTSSASGKVVLYPYQVDPLRATETPGVKEVTLMWGPRLGKSTIWKFSLLKRLHDGNTSGLILYPSLAMGLKMNADTLEPLIRTLPELAADLRKRGNITKDSYRLNSCNSVIYFLGGGAQVINYTANWCCLDEADQVEVGNEGEEGENIDQLRALKIRMQTFKDRMLIDCSSPTNYAGLIYNSFKSGSRHVWNLRCLHCNNLTPANQLSFPLKSGSYAGLQWMKDENENVIADSIRWICPICGHEHVEADAQKMASLGEYVAQNPDEKEHLSYQVGALANPWLWSWPEIAEAQEEAVDTSGRKHLKNSILGMPYAAQRANDALSQSIPEILATKQQDLPQDARGKIACVTCGIDQQLIGLTGQHYYVYSVRAWDEQGNSWSVAHGNASTNAELEQVVNSTYCGQKILLALVDAGGFSDNASRVDPFVKQHYNTVYYKGGDARTLALQQGQNWRWSDNVQYLALCNASFYQEKLLDLIYGPKRPIGFAWSIPAMPDRFYISQIAAMRPNNRMRDGRGESFSNWNHNGERHDFFDTEKMALACLDICCTLYPPEQWPKGKIPAFLLAEMLRRNR